MSTRETVREVIFEANTRAGRLFDVFLIVAILTSVAIVFLESIPRLHEEWGGAIKTAEWVFTGLFLVEYCLRLWSIGRPRLYAKSFFGIVDLVSILPTFLALFIPGAHMLLVVRVLRVLRVFRVLRLSCYVGESEVLLRALRQSRRKITVFVMSVLALVVIFGSIMYIVEGEEGGFTSIPTSMYWAIVTLTTVGYGDVSPVTALGQVIASTLMVVGYGIIAVPTGIVTFELAQASRRQGQEERSCPECSAEGHVEEASFCWRCGSSLYRRIILPGDVRDP